jgi:hypothetical protein
LRTTAAASAARAATNAISPGNPAIFFANRLADFIRLHRIHSATSSNWNIKFDAFRQAIVRLHLHNPNRSTRHQ